MYKRQEPQFKGYEYLLEKYLKPRPRTDIVRALAEETEYEPHVIYTLLDPDRLDCLQRSLSRRLEG